MSVNNYRKYKPYSRYLKYIELKSDEQGQNIPQLFDLTDGIPKANGDRIVSVNDAYAYRLDLLSAEFYGTSKLWWVIALANNIDDVLNWPVAGDIIRIPADETIRNLL